MIQLTEEQNAVKGAAKSFIDHFIGDDPNSQWKSKEYITIGGYAGTGKTTMIRSIREQFSKDLKFHYMTFTGKASMRIAQTLGDDYFSAYPGDNCTTIHQAIYKVKRGPNGKFYGFTFDPDKTSQNVIIVDEASMVPREIFDDLMKKNVPIIFIGDHGQLPPISKKNEEPFNLMSDPIYKLNKIHRNVDGIKQLATAIRLKEQIKSYSNVTLLPFKNNIDLSSYDFERDIIIVGGNYTRVNINKQILSSLGFNKVVDVGMKVIALRNNWRSDPPMFNGQIFTIKDIIASEEEKYVLNLEDETGLLYENVDVAKYSFGVAKPWTPKSKLINNRHGEPIYIPYTPFDYAYAITCHKSQGSEWDNVIVVNESKMFRDDATRWLYTAVTRAAKKLAVYNM